MSAPGHVSLISKKRAEEEEEESATISSSYYSHTISKKTRSDNSNPYSNGEEEDNYYYYEYSSTYDDSYTDSSWNSEWTTDVSSGKEKSSVSSLSTSGSEEEEGEDSKLLIRQKRKRQRVSRRQRSRDSEEGEEEGEEDYESRWDRNNTTITRNTAATHASKKKKTRNRSGDDDSSLSTSNDSFSEESLVVSKPKRGGSTRQRRRLHTHNFFHPSCILPFEMYLQVGLFLTEKELLVLLEINKYSYHKINAADPFLWRQRCFSLWRNKQGFQYKKLQPYDYLPNHLTKGNTSSSSPGVEEEDDSEQSKYQVFNIFDNYENERRNSIQKELYIIHTMQAMIREEYYTSTGPHEALPPLKGKGLLEEKSHSHQSANHIKKETAAATTTGEQDPLHPETTGPDEPSPVEAEVLTPSSSSYGAMGGLYYYHHHGSDASTTCDKSVMVDRIQQHRQWYHAMHGSPLTPSPHDRKRKEDRKVSFHGITTEDDDEEEDINDEDDERASSNGRGTSENSTKDEEGKNYKNGNNNNNNNSNNRKTSTRKPRSTVHSSKKKSSRKRGHSSHSHHRGHKKKNKHRNHNKKQHHSRNRSGRHSHRNKRSKRRKRMREKHQKYTSHHHRSRDRNRNDPYYQGDDLFSVSSSSSSSSDTTSSFKPSHTYEAIQQALPKVKPSLLPPSPYIPSPSSNPPKTTAMHPLTLPRSNRVDSSPLPPSSDGKSLPPPTCHKKWWELSEEEKQQQLQRLQEKVLLDEKTKQKQQKKEKDAAVGNGSKDHKEEEDEKEEDEEKRKHKKPWWEVLDELGEKETIVEINDDGAAAVTGPSTLEETTDGGGPSVLTTSVIEAHKRNLEILQQDESNHHHNQHHNQDSSHNVNTARLRPIMVHPSRRKSAHSTHKATKAVVLSLRQPSPRTAQPPHEVSSPLIANSSKPSSVLAAFHAASSTLPSLHREKPTKLYRKVKKHTMKRRWNREKETHRLETHTDHEEGGGHLHQKKTVFSSEFFHRSRPTQTRSVRSTSEGSAPHDGKEGGAGGGTIPNRTVKKYLTRRAKREVNPYEELEEYMVITRAKSTLIYELNQHSYYCQRRRKQNLLNHHTSSFSSLPSSHNNSNNPNNTNNNNNNDTTTTNGILRNCSFQSLEEEEEELRHPSSPHDPSTSMVGVCPISFKFAYYMSLRDARRSLIRLSDLLDNVWAMTVKQHSGIRLVKFVLLQPNNNTTTNNNNTVSVVRGNGGIQIGMKMLSERDIINDLPFSLMERFLVQSNHNNTNNNNNNNNASPSPHSNSAVLRVHLLQSGGSVVVHNFPPLKVQRRNIINNNNNNKDSRNTNTSPTVIRHYSEAAAKAFELEPFRTLSAIQRESEKMRAERVFPSGEEKGTTTAAVDTRRNNCFTLHEVLHRLVEKENKKKAWVMRQKDFVSSVQGHIREGAAASTATTTEVPPLPTELNPVFMLRQHAPDEESEIIRDALIREEKEDLFFASPENSAERRQTLLNDWGWTLSNSHVKLFTIDIYAPPYLQRLHRQQDGC